ncbi:MAG: nucleotide-binding protein [Defluviitaleaceae bacterium]|nr:nucleotide-binding protein [Defluviitaleaceae bacterium]
MTEETYKDAVCAVENVKLVVQKYVPQYNGYLIKLVNKYVSENDYKSLPRLTSVLSEIREGINKYMSQEISKSDKVFIVHGHNEAMKLAVSGIVSKLGLTPIILHEQTDKGQTIIEKFEKHSEDVSFAIVLLSADDKMESGDKRARQNVILELGYFFGKLGRQNVVALKDTSETVELPSDTIGILYKQYDCANGAWRFELAKELKAAGFDVDANKLI